MIVKMESDLMVKMENDMIVKMGIPAKGMEEMGKRILTSIVNQHNVIR